MADESAPNIIARDEYINENFHLFYPWIKLLRMIIVLIVDLGLDLKCSRLFQSVLILIDGEEKRKKKQKKGKS